MPVGHRLRERTRDGRSAAASLYPLALGCGTLGAGAGVYAAGAVVPAVVLAVLGGLVLATTLPDGAAVGDGGR
ncbi:MAG: hypothetical protein V5A31_01320 [Haloferacaceae archaeon]